MFNLFRVAGKAVPMSESRIRPWTMFGARVIFWPLALLALVALALQLGVWEREFKIAGPFAAETSPDRHSLTVEVPAAMHSGRWAEPLLADDNEHPSQSILGLRINGGNVGPAHSPHETIREGRNAGFSHWGARVIFSLPQGVMNVPETTATLSYKLQPRSWLTLMLAVSSALFGWLSYERTIRPLARRHAQMRTTVVSRSPYWLLFGLCCTGIAGSMAYATTSAYALATGWALPTTALIRWSPIVQWAAQNEPYLGHLLLTLAGFGMVVTWIASSNPAQRRSVRSDELRLRRLLLWCGFPVVACTLVFCMSAMWTGILRPGDPNAANIGGLIPFSDAANYLTASYDQFRDGTWNVIALRRPLAAAFRSVLLVFGNFSLQLMLVLQAFLVAGAICFAAYAVAKWRGIWAGLAFLALTYIYVRIFVPTTMTEALGLFWALLAIPFFTQAFASGSARPALAAFALTTVALMTRMGSMFTIPALLIWLVWQFGRDARAKLRIAGAAICILLSVIGVSSLLQSAYGTADRNSSAGNFSYVICGLTMGTTFEGCLTKLDEKGVALPPQEDARARLLYSMAWENFEAQPGTFFRRLALSAASFATEFPDVIWKGYGTAIDEPEWLYPNVLTAVCLIGLLHIVVRRAKAAELTFWMLLWTSIVASASIIYFEDGARALAASHPLIALFFAMGMSNPTSEQGETLASSSRWSRYGAFGLIVVAMLFVCIPWMAHRFFPVETIRGDRLALKADDAFVFGGRRMSGFLVVADGLPLRSDVPSLHLSDFDSIIRQSHVEYYQELIHPTLPPLPFGFVFAPRLEIDIQSRFQYIVPAEVVERRDVAAWHFKLKRWGYKPARQNEYWFYVANAEPWLQ